AGRPTPDGVKAVSVKEQPRLLGCQPVGQRLFEVLERLLLALQPPGGPLALQFIGDRRSRALLPPGGLAAPPGWGGVLGRPRGVPPGRLVAALHGVGHHAVAAVVALAGPEELLRDLDAP